MNDEGKKCPHCEEPLEYIKLHECAWESCYYDGRDRWDTYAGDVEHVYYACPHCTEEIEYPYKE